MSKYGKLGMDVGFVGRWSRLVWGILILAPFAFGIVEDLSDSGGWSLSFYGFSALYLVGIALAYTVVYRVFGEIIFARSNPWVNTLIFVGPAFVVAWWDFIIAPFVGTELPNAFSLAMGVYIGLSFILQWRIKYGGCEVVALPIILFKKRYTTYCMPLVALDAVEKKVVETLAKSGTTDPVTISERGA